MMFRKMFCIFFVFFVVLIQFDGSLGMTRSQLKKTLTIMKNQCLPKHKVTEDKVGKIEQGVFIEDHNVMCYIHCVYKTIQVMRGDMLDKDLVNKQVDILYPNDMKAAVKSTVDKCIHIQNNYSDHCEGVFNSVKCLYETDPVNFVFP